MLEAISEESMKYQIECRRKNSFFSVHIGYSFDVINNIIKS